MCFSRVAGKLRELWLTRFSGSMFKGTGFHYPMIVPPFDFDSFETLKKSEAQRLFDWYISCIPERIELLDKCFNDVWGCNVEFDYSVDSLDQLWQAFQGHIKTQTKSARQIRAENKDMPGWVIEDMLSDRRSLTRETFMIALDIGMYAGEVYSRNWPGIAWGFFTKPTKMLSVNEPVLLGFKNEMYMDPSRTTLVGCYRFMDEPNPEFFRELSEVWAEDVPEE